MFKWLTIDDSAAKLAQHFGKHVSVDDVLELAFNGVLRVCAALPRWKSTGVGEVHFFSYPEGSRLECMTDGVFRQLSKDHFQVLQAHRRLSLANLRVELFDEDGRTMKAFVGPDAPEIVIGDLRVSAGEIQRFIDSVPDDDQRAQTSVPDDNERKCAQPSKALVGWQREMLENWEKISDARPDKVSHLGRHAATWLKKNGPSTVIAPQQKEGSLAWLTSDGSVRTVTEKTILNVIREWEKSGRIPGRDR